MKSAYRKINRRLNKYHPDLRVIAFSVDSTPPHYVIYLDTTVVNSKDSVYNFHSR
jgi:hypothetical protein